jgi:hypothetical protein
MRGGLVLVVWLAAIGVAHAQRGAPRIDGRPIWDGPIAAAPEPFRDAWTMRRDTDRARLGRAPASRDAFLRWSSSTLEPWLRARQETLSRMEHRLGELAPGATPRELVAATVLLATFAEETITAIEAVRPPHDLASDADALAAYDRARDSALQTLRERIVPWWQTCADRAAQAPEAMRAWAGACATRASAVQTRLDEVRRTEEAARAAAPAPGTVVLGDRMPSACGVGRVEDVPPEMPQAPHGAPLEIAIVEGPSTLGAAAQGRVLDAVTTALARDPSLRVVPRDEVRRAAALVRARRVSADGPVCGQAPPLASLLAPAHPNLVIGVVSRVCVAATDHAGDTCWMMVDFVAPPPSSDPDLESWSAELAAPEREASWIAAASHLARGTPAFGLLGTLAPPIDPSAR